MKQQKNIETKAESQNRFSIQKASPLPLHRRGDGEQQESLNSNYDQLLNVATIPTSARWWRHGRGFIVGKGPPGRARGPDSVNCRNPDNKAGPFVSITSLKNQFNKFNKYRYSNFLQLLIFKIMKKQILILVFLVLAAFANVNKSYAQCDDDALHPMAGKLYHYIITTSGGGTAKTYEWIVTKSTGIVTAGTFATTIAPGTSTYAILNGGAADASITWSPTLIADALAGNDYYVAIKYVATNSEGCDVNNVKAYKLVPVNKFQIDLANVTLAGTDLASGNVCTSLVVSATITAATPTITYDYGLSSMYVKITARNFSGSWDMTVANTLLANKDAVETGALAWSRTIGGTEIAVTPGTAITIPETTVDPNDDEVFYLRLEMDHNTFEGLADEAFVFTVDGKFGILDDVSSACVAEADAVTQTILARPTITDGTDLGPFIMP